MAPVAERLLLITDRRLGDMPAQVARALAGVPRGVALVQLREKDLEGRALYELARAVRAITTQAGARLVINDRVDVALAVGADGVHLPEDGLSVADARALLGAGRLVGASTHAAATARARLAEGADLVTLGPIWETPSKAGMGAPLGTAALAGLAGAAGVFALGGIDGPPRAREARQAGAHGIAVIRGVFAAADPGRAAAGLVAELAVGPAA